MSVIYVLQKEVPGLGRLTKIGMTTRSGQARADEYGGGGWVVVGEIGVAVADSVGLKSIESRIHDRLREFRCAAATEFGLTEVFTCSSDEAIAAARIEIGSKADDQDQIQRMRTRTMRAVERKIIQAHAGEIARLHLGKYEKVDRMKLWRDKEESDTPPWNTPESEIAEWRIHRNALNALDRINAQAVTFRAMLAADLETLKTQWRVAQVEAEAKAEREEKARKRLLEKGERELEQRRDEEQRIEQARMALAEHEQTVGALKKRQTSCRSVITGSVLFAGFSVAINWDLWTNLAENELVELLVAPFLLGAIAAVGTLVLQRTTRALREIQDEWNSKH